MLSYYTFPAYRSPYLGFYGYGVYPGFIGYPNYYSSNNIIGSAIANQGMNVIGTGAIGGTQIANPVAIF